ncbi:MAG: RNA polymerase sigma factor [Ruminococcus sp.]|nr:RNA polymerase sigma factor [Ruminococcus sp.]
MTVTQFEILLKQHGNFIFGFCCHLTGSTDLAEDLYEMAVLKAFSMICKINCKGSDEDSYKSARNYIIGIAVRLYKNEIRKKMNNSLVYDNEIIDSIKSEQDIEADFLENDIKSAVRQAVDNLSDKFRIVVYMFYFVDMSIEQISCNLKIPKGTVKSRLNRARAIIKKEMEEKGYDGY